MVLKWGGRALLYGCLWFAWYSLSVDGTKQVNLVAESSSAMGDLSTLLLGIAAVISALGGVATGIITALRSSKRERDTAAEKGLGSGITEEEAKQLKEMLQKGKADGKA